VPNLPSTMPGGKGGGFMRFKMEYQKITDERILEIDLKEATIDTHSGDIDIVGGVMDPALLDKNIKYLCDYWARFSRELDRCEDMCEPFEERWDRASKSCVPAFTIN